MHTKSIVVVLGSALILAACSQQQPSQTTTRPDNTQAAPATPAPSQPPVTQQPAPAEKNAPEDAPAGAPQTPSSATSAGNALTGSAAPPAKSQTPAVESPAKESPTVREITVPDGTSISVRLRTPVASDTSKPEDPVRGVLTKSIVVDGVTAVPAGAEITGTVLEANRSGRVKGRASVAFRFDRLIVRDETHPIRTVRIARQAAASTREDVKKGAIGAGAGALVGAIVGGKKGAAIGAGAGGTGAVLATRGAEMRLPAGTVVAVTLQQALTVPVPLAPR